MPVFKEKVFFLNSIILGRLGVNFSKLLFSTKRVPPKSCLGGKIGCETTQNSHLGGKTWHDRAKVLFRGVFLRRANLY